MDNQTFFVTMNMNLLAPPSSLMGQHSSVCRTLAGLPSLLSHHIPSGGLHDSSRLSLPPHDSGLRNLLRALLNLLLDVQRSVQVCSGAAHGMVLADLSSRHRSQGPMQLALGRWLCGSCTSGTNHPRCGPRQSCRSAARLRTLSVSNLFQKWCGAQAGSSRQQPQLLCRPPCATSCRAHRMMRRPLCEATLKASQLGLCEWVMWRVSLPCRSAAWQEHMGAHLCMCTQIASEQAHARARTHGSAGGSAHTRSQRLP